MASVARLSPDSHHTPSLASNPEKLPLKGWSGTVFEPLPYFPGKQSSVCVHLQGVYLTSLLSPSHLPSQAHGQYLSLGIDPTYVSLL